MWDRSMVDKAAMWQVFSEYLDLPCHPFIPLTTTYHPGLAQQANK
jgi:hypothetical protein